MECIWFLMSVADDAVDVGAERKARFTVAFSMRSKYS